MHCWNITFDFGEQMNAHECSNRLKDWVSKHKYCEEFCEIVDVEELIDELNQMEFDESGDEE
jgi:hypothetical protein